MKIRKILYATVMAVALGRLVYSLAVDIPIFSELYTSKGVELPILTQMTLSLGRWVGSHLILTILICLAILAVSVFIAEKKLPRHSPYLYLALTALYLAHLFFLQHLMKMPLK